MSVHNGPALTGRSRQEPSTVDSHAPGCRSCRGPGAGPICITRCAVCTAEGRYPRLTADAALRLVIEHRDHHDAEPSHEANP